jgi:hypothetical protein
MTRREIEGLIDAIANAIDPRTVNHDLIDALIDLADAVLEMGAVDGET